MRLTEIAIIVGIIVVLTAGFIYFIYADQSFMSMNEDEHYTDQYYECPMHEEHHEHQEMWQHHNYEMYGQHGRGYGMWMGSC